MKLALHTHLVDTVFCSLDGPVFAPLEACSALRAISLQVATFQERDAVASLGYLTQVGTPDSVLCTMFAHFVRHTRGELFNIRTHPVLFVR